MKRIILFISSLQKGGSERVMVNLAEYFQEQKYDVILVTQYQREKEYSISPKIRRVYSEPDESMLDGGRIRNFCVRFRTLRNLWKTYRPDVILSFLGKNNLMAVAAAAFLPIKVAVSVRGEPTMEYQGKFMQFIAKTVFRFADGGDSPDRAGWTVLSKSSQKKKCHFAKSAQSTIYRKKSLCGQRGLDCGSRQT